MYFNFQTKIIKYTLRDNLGAYIDLTDKQKVQLEAHAQQVLPILRDARMRMDTCVADIDFSRVRKLTNDVETLMGAEDTERLIATLSELIQILSRYDTYTFGEDVGRTVFYRNLLEGIVNGRQQVNLMILQLSNKLSPDNY